MPRETRLDVFEVPKAPPGWNKPKTETAFDKVEHRTENGELEFDTNFRKTNIKIIVYSWRKFSNSVSQCQ